MDVADLAGLLHWAIAARLAAIGLALGWHRQPRASRWLALGGSLIASVLTGSLGAAVVASGTPVTGALLTHTASGFALGYAVDGLSGWFLLVLATLGAPIALYSVGYFAHAIPPERTAFVGIGFNLLIGSVELVFVADGVIGFLFAWELMTLSTAALVATEHERLESRRAAYLYLAMSHVATGCLIAAFLVLAAGADSLAFSAMFAHPAPFPLRHLLFVLFLLGFGLKAGMVPLHVWLPEAHPVAPSAISALMSGVMIKTGVYGIFRVCALGLGTPPAVWGGLLLALGAVSMVLGVLYALMQHDLKRLLAYHSIENVGIILVALAAGMLALAAQQRELAVLGFTGALLHVLNHALFKGLLFLGAGSVVAATGTRQIERLGGLIHRMPWTAGLFLVAAAAISGLPFLNGFVSEWLVFQSLLQGFHRSSDSFARVAYPITGALLGLTTALAAACFVKAFGITFLALPRSSTAETARESSSLMLAPQAFLALLCVGIGLVPGPLIRRLSSVAGRLLAPGTTAPQVPQWWLVTSGADGFDWIAIAPVALVATCALGFALLVAHQPSLKLRTAPTWGCGGMLTPETEYTATAFSKPLMMIFSSIYRPTREVSTVQATPYYATEVLYRAEVEPTFERFVYRPLTQAVLGLAARMRVIQDGSLHAYLAYVMALILSLIVLLWWRG